MADRGGSVIAMLAGIMLVVLLGLMRGSAATNYVVNSPTSLGGGWTIVTENNTSYDDIFQNTTLFVGDSLTFRFIGLDHDLYEVSAADAASCDSSNPIQTYNSTVTITLNPAGQHGFLCSYRYQCSLYGMHLVVTVLDAPPAPLGAPASGL